MLIDAFGKIQSAEEWSADPMCRCTAELIVARIKAGMRPELAISAPLSDTERPKFRTPVKVAGKHSRYHGVTWDKNRRKWKAQAKHAGLVKPKFLGYHDDEIAAARAYDAFVKVAHGANAVLNLR